MADEFSVTGDGLRSLAADLEIGAQSLLPAAAVTLTVIGGRVEERARRNARSHTSTGATRAQMQYGGNTAADVANSIHGDLEGPNIYRIRYGEGVPLAGLWELGNKRSAPDDPTFKHPVFGNKKVWVSQAKHPFMRPALAEETAAIHEAMETTWERALGPVGLAPEGMLLSNAETRPGSNVGRVPAGYPGGAGGEFMSLGG